VWDPTTNDYRVYSVFSCAQYSLSNWLGAGRYLDNQTGGVTSTFYGQSGDALLSFTPDGAQHNYDCSPVWSIRNC
jgi:hypothetical protein